MKKLRIGITGGIGAGKSVVSQLLKSMGYAVYDSDSNAKELMNSSPEIKSALINLFGNEAYSSGMLNRRFISSQVFSNPKILAEMNGIVHPAVFRHFNEWADSQPGITVFIESAILYQCGLDRFVDRVIYVDAPQEIRIARAMHRDNSEREEVENRIKNQTASEFFALSHADAIITNDDTHSVIAELNTVLEKLQYSNI